jgi:hypothetical protein
MTWLEYLFLKQKSRSLTESNCNPLRDTKRNTAYIDDLIINEKYTLCKKEAHKGISGILIHVF